MERVNGEDSESRTHLVWVEARNLTVRPYPLKFILLYFDFLIPSEVLNDNLHKE